MLITLSRREIIISNGSIQTKPKVIVDYNCDMNLIDKNNLMLNTIECLRKSFTWHKKYFIHLIDMAALKSFYLNQETTLKKTALRVQFEFSKAAD